MNDFFHGDDNFVGTKGLVFIGDKILVYRRDEKAPKYPLHLDVPGGGAEPGETPFDTFRREVKEEFGLDIIAEQIVYNRRYPSSLNPNEFGWYAVAKLPQNLGGQIKFGDEGLEFILMSLDEFLKRNDAWPAYQKRAEDYASSLINKSESY
jgi:8-oxo-dGTP diphosphatase